MNSIASVRDMHFHWTRADWNMQGNRLPSVAPCGTNDGKERSQGNQPLKGKESHRIRTTDLLVP